MLNSIAKLKKQKKPSVDEDIGQKESHTLMKDNICITTLENSFCYWPKSSICLSHWMQTS